MSFASQSGHARTNPSSPQAFGVCDRCGRWWNFVQLRWQYDWRGAALLNTYALVCPDCYDTPQEQLRAIVVPADPLPIIQARVEPFTSDETDQRSLSAPTVYDPTTGIPVPNTDVRVTQSGDTRTTQPMGPVRQIPPSPGLDQNAISPLQGTIQYGVVLPIISVTSNGTTIISATCSAPHGLSDGAQISAEGFIAANGFYNVTVTTATAFTYEVSEALPANSLLTGGARIVTANVGVAYGYSQIPQTGI